MTRFSLSLVSRIYANIFVRMSTSRTPRQILCYSKGKEELGLRTTRTRTLRPLSNDISCLLRDYLKLMCCVDQALRTITESTTTRVVIKIVLYIVHAVHSTNSETSRTVELHDIPRNAYDARMQSIKPRNYKRV